MLKVLVEIRLYHTNLGMERVIYMDCFKGKNAFLQSVKKISFVCAVIFAALRIIANTIDMYALSNPMKSYYFEVADVLTCIALFFCVLSHMLEFIIKDR